VICRVARLHRRAASIVTMEERAPALVAGAEEVRMAIRAPIPTESVAILATPPPSRRLVRRAMRVGLGQGLIVGAVVAVAGWLFASDLDEVPENVFFAGIVGAWVWSGLGALLGRAAVAIPAVRRALGDDGLTRAGFVVPAVGLALVAPISLQALVGVVPVLFGADFDAWAVFAVMGTAHVHIAFAIAMGVLGWRLSRGEVATQATLWPAVLLSLVPGVLIVFPPLLVWGTGLVVSRAFAAEARRWFLDDEAA